jgi:hypothetical protein
MMFLPGSGHDNHIVIVIVIVIVLASAAITKK